MFARLPHKFTAPFGLLGDEAKLAFPTQPGGIAKLASVRNIPDNDSYWEQYFVLFDSPSDVFSLITPHHIRRALLDAPENVATLVRVVSSRLFQLMSDHTFPSSTHTVATFASSLLKAGTGTPERNTTKEVLNCLRVLQRVLPVIFELEGDASSFEQDLLWKRGDLDGTDHALEAERSPQFVIDDEDDEIGTEPRTATSEISQDHSARVQLPCLAERLIGSIFDLLFCCGFTLPQKMQVDHHKIQYIIWEKGVGSTLDLNTSTTYDSHRIEVLRLLLVILSKQIYISPNSLFSKPSSYTLYAVQKTPRRKILTLLCSLLNTAMNSTTFNDKGFGSMAGRLPYNHLVFKGEDPRSTLVGLCLQNLCILLDFQSGSARDREGNDGSPLPAARTNAFRYFMMKLHRVQDFEFIHQGIIGILDQQIAATNNVLPGARKSIPYAPETVLFFWKMLALNKKFRSHVLESANSMNLIVNLVCYGLEIKDKPQQHGLCRALSYIIQTLSAESSFGVKLASPLKVQLPTKWTTAGTTGDFLINAIYAMVATTSGSLNSLYPALIITLSNSAPYFRNLTVTSSSRLIQLFTSLSSPLFLLADEGHPRLLFFMLEVFNTMILHHLSENANLIYGILSSHKKFEDLGTFTLAKGLKEIRRVQLAREEQARGSRDESNLPSAGSKKGHFMESDGTNNVATPTRPDVSTETEEDHVDIVSSAPSTGSTSGHNSEHDPSDKARGKMKERRSSSLETNPNLDRLTAAGIGRNGFVPTHEWVASWQQGLPLDIVMLVISELLPKIQELQASRKANSAAAILEFLSSIDLKHVLPAAPSLTPRRFIWSDASIVWQTSLIWGEIYVRAMTPLGIWNSTNVRLFHVKHTQPQRQLTDAVSHVVGGLLRRNSEIPQNRLNLSTLSSLAAQHKAALERGGVRTVAQLLFTSPQDVARKCRISPIEFKAIIHIVCTECGDFQLHCLDDVKSEGDEMFSTGDMEIDLALGGGVRTGMVWEIVGESASGKTQLALQLSLYVQIAPEVGGLDGSCCYLTTSSKLPTRRLLQILKNRKVLSASSGCSLDNVHTIPTPSTSALLHVLSQNLKDFIQQNQTTGLKPVKLVVIDALAELFHDTEKTTTATLVERSRNVAEISTILHALAAECRIAIVVLNEVIDVFDKGYRYSDDKTDLLYSEQSRWFSRGDSVRGEDRKEASLGLAWANQVNARILLSRTGRRRYLGETVDRELKMHKTGLVEEHMSNTPSSPQAQDDKQSTLVRRFNVIFSSVSSPVSFDYIVAENGVSALKGTITYPSTPSEFLTLEDPARITGQRERSHQIAPLDIGVIEDHNVGIDDLPTISDGGLLPGPEDEWDQYWENEEIPADLDLSIPDIT